MSAYDIRRVFMDIMTIDLLSRFVSFVFQTISDAA